MGTEEGIISSQCCPPDTRSWQGTREQHGPDCTSRQRMHPTPVRHRVPWGDGGPVATGGIRRHRRVGLQSEKSRVHAGRQRAGARGKRPTRALRGAGPAAETRRRRGGVGGAAAHQAPPPSPRPRSAALHRCAQRRARQHLFGHLWLLAVWPLWPYLGRPCSLCLPRAPPCCSTTETGRGLPS